MTIFLIVYSVILTLWVIVATIFCFVTRDKLHQANQCKQLEKRNLELQKSCSQYELLLQEHAKEDERYLAQKAEREKEREEMNYQIGNLREIANIRNAECRELQGRIEGYTLAIDGYTASLAQWEQQMREKKHLIISALKQEKDKEKQTILAQYEQDMKIYTEEMEKITQHLDSLRQLEQTAMQERLNRDETLKKNTLGFSERGISEMHELYSICYRLSNPVPLYKAIYDIYIKNHYNDLVARLGVKGVSGIYKITNISDGKVYIGQSVDVGERWKQHIKRGSGCETGTVAGSKLYDAMMNEGLGNFSFELLEQVDKENLGQQEKFWIKHFNSVEYGYNMKAGG